MEANYFPLQKDAYKLLLTDPMNPVNHDQARKNQPWVAVLGGTPSDSSLKQQWQYLDWYTRQLKWSTLLEVQDTIQLRSFKN